MSEENSIIRKLSSKISYNTCKKFELSYFPITFGTFLVNITISFDKILFNIPLSCIGLFSALIGTSFVLSNACDYTKDINKVKKLYEEFLKNYDKLNKLFDLKNPVEICTMYYYLLYKGYLSKNKEFTFSAEETKDIIRILGSEVIRGNGVCRHISKMLCDILNERGIKSFPVGVYSFQDLIFNLFDEKINKEILKNKEQIKRGNHMISFALDDNKSYFLDSSSILTFYRLNKNDKEILESEEEQLIIKKEFSKIFNSKEDYKWLKDNLLKEHISQKKKKEE